MRERYGAQNPRSWMLRTHTQTGGVTLRAQQPENNIVRAAFQAMAAALGGVQSMALSCFDEALALPTEFAQQLALRTQQILAHETGIRRVADPLGGSLLRRVADRPARGRGAPSSWRQIERLGGAVAAIEQQLHAALPSKRAAYAEQLRDRIRRARRGGTQPPHRVAAGAGSACKANSSGSTPPRPGATASRRSTRLRRERDAARRRTTHSRPCAPPPPTPPPICMPPILAAVRAYATVGEISDALRGVFGTHREHA